MTRHFVLAIALGLTLASTAFGVSQTIQFDLQNNQGYGDGSQYFYSATNAQIFSENFGTQFATYWEPTISNVPGEVVYRVPFDFPIQTAVLTTHVNLFFPYDANASDSLDASPDGVNWVNVGLVDATHRDAISIPWDISSIVAGSQTVFVRNTFVGINYGSFDSTQFLRTSYLYTDEAFVLSANGVPEPSTLVLGLCGLGVFAAWAYRRRIGQRECGLHVGR